MPNSNILIYTTEDGLTKIEATFEDDTVWLSIDQMAELFQRDKSTISRHIKKIFEDGELDRISVVANFATTASDGKTYHVDYYNLDVIISMNYYQELGIYVLLKKYFGEKYLIFMQQVLIIILMLMNQFYFLSRCKIKCTGQHINIPLQRLFFLEQMLKRITWGSPLVRAFETAQIVLKDRCIPIIMDERLVEIIKNEILNMGKLPFYGTAMSHIASQRVALNAGFYPAWIELYCE